MRARADRARRAGAARVVAHALDLGERDEFPLERSAAAAQAGARSCAASSPSSRARASRWWARELEISGQVPLGSGLSSSAALEVALCLALIELGRADSAGGGRAALDRLEIARLCARVENDWVGAHTGLLDQLASLYGAPDTALLHRLPLAARSTPVALALGAWRLVVLDSGERHAHASSGYNERRAECARACELLGVRSLREADSAAVAGLPEPLRDRAIHVIEENARVLEAVAALRGGRSARRGRAAERLAREPARPLRGLHAGRRGRRRSGCWRAGAAGARMVGGGFGGSVLGLFAPDATARSPPRRARCAPARAPTCSTL